MRPEHVALMRLAWDADFRRLAKGGFPQSLPRLIPGVNVALLSRTTWDDVEEDAARRIFTFSTRFRQLAPCFHEIFRIVGGNLALTEAVRLLWVGFGGLPPRAEAQLVIDPFMPVNIVRAVEGVLSRGDDTAVQLNQFRPLLDYEFGLFRASLVLDDRPDPQLREPFLAGASLIHADFDLNTAAKEIRRCSAAGVPDQLILERVRLIPAQSLLAIVVDDESVREIQFPSEAVDVVRNGLADRAGPGWQVLIDLRIVQASQPIAPLDAKE